MPANFDWQTEEESQDVWEAPAPARSPQRRRWVIPLLLVLLMMAVLYAGYILAEQRISQAQAQVAEEVRASQRLARQAALNTDRELFLTVLSGRYPIWTAMQEQLLQENLQFEQAGRALRLDPQPEPPQLETVTVTPELSEAEVVTLHSYTANGGTQELRLEQSRIYRRGNDRWLLSPPQPDYWGEWQSWRGQFLALHFPARDAVPAEQLAVELDAVLTELCAASFGLDCPNEFAVSVRLEKSPDILLIADEPLGAPQVAGEIDLPTFSLVGMPADSAAREALFQAYARRIVPTVVAELVRYHCCEHVLFFNATLAWQLRELGIGQWPLEVADYEQMIDSADDKWWTLQRLWAVSTVPEGGWEERWHAYSLVELLLADSGQNAARVAATLQRKLSTAQDLFAWVQSGRDYQTVDTLLSRWRGHLFERINTREMTASLPPQDIEVGRCLDGGDYQTLRHDLHSGAWMANAASMESGSLQHAAKTAPAPVISPTGDNMLYQEGRQIVRRPAGGGQAEVIGSGVRPFWLTENVYGFISDKHLLLADTKSDSPQRVFSLNRIFQTITGDLLQRLLVSQVLPVPNGSGSLLLIVDSPYENSNYVVLVRPAGSSDLLDSLSEPQIKVVFQARGKVTGPEDVHFSDEGRWLTVTSAGRATGGLYLYDMDGERIIIDAAATGATPAAEGVSAQSWSDDGQWVAWLTGTHIELVALNSGQALERYFLPLPQGVALDASDCLALTWVD